MSFLLGLDAQAAGRAFHQNRDALCPRSGTLSAAAPGLAEPASRANAEFPRVAGSLPLFVLQNVKIV